MYSSSPMCPDSVKHPVGARTRETPDIRQVEKLALVPDEQLQAEHRKLFGTLGFGLDGMFIPMAGFHGIYWGFLGHSKAIETG